jgi:flagella basal body P-ring formation protein FlgA
MKSLPPLWFPLLISLLLCPGTQAQGADAIEDLNTLKKSVEGFVRQQTAGLPGQVDISAGMIDNRLRLPKCNHPEFFVPSATRLWGNTLVGVRCQAPSAWTVYVPVTVQVVAPIVMTARPLSQGHIITQADLTVQNGDLTQQPVGVISDIQQAVGKTLASSVSSGQPLRLDMLRSPMVIRQGQIVKLVAQGNGFQVSSEGKALANASAGQAVSVRLPSGQVINGTAKPDGTVEVPF